MPPRTTTWPLEPHTVGKHKVLEGYMQAWLPIMTITNDRVLFVDAFAGPGEYSKGEPGSPVIALDAFISHRARGKMRCEIKYLFIEKEPSRSVHLKGVLEGRRHLLPNNCTYEVINSTFDETLTGVLDTIELQRRQLAPAFVMIDPFGVSGTPMKTIARILANPKSEVYISFMYAWINRFKDNPSIEPHLDELFGCTEWRQGRWIDDDARRKRFFYDLYTRQLKSKGAEHVIHFELYEGERLVYAIFFGTGSAVGCDKMKEAIWNVSPFGDYRFRGGSLGQLTLGEAVVDFTPLVNELQSKFRLQDWQDIESVQHFMKSDATLFCSRHLRHTLNEMESRGDIWVRRPKGKGGGTGTYEGQQLGFSLGDVAQEGRANRNFPSGTTILFH